MLELSLIQFGYKRKIKLCYRSHVANTETKRGENSIKISTTHVNYFKTGLIPGKKHQRNYPGSHAITSVHSVFWQEYCAKLVILICDWFILIWSQGLVPRTVHMKRFEEQVAGTCPKNSSQFEFVGLVAGTKF